MSDLKDEDLDYLRNNVGGESGFVRPLIDEIRRHRAAKAADEERVRSVVREAMVAALTTAEWRALNLIGVTHFDQVVPLADTIADRAAKQLASAAVRLTPEERAQLRHHIAAHKATHAYSCSLIGKLLDGVPDAPPTLSATDAIDLEQARDYIAASVGWNAFPDPADAANVMPIPARWLALLDRLLATVRP